MCYNSACLGSLLLVVLFGFAILIYFLLKYRKNFLAENLQLSPDKVYETISQRAARYGLSKSDLIYGIYQDKTASIVQIVVKNDHGEVVGTIERHLGVRGADITLGNEKYKIEYPLKWRKLAHLKKANGELLGSFERLTFSYRKHRFIFPNIGTFTSQCPAFNFRYPYEYSMNGSVVGITQEISTRKIGSITLFPSSYPLSMRVFILAINASGI